MPRKPGGVISQELKGLSLLPSWSAKGCWGAFASLYWGVLGFWGSWGAGGRGCGGSAQWRLHSCNEGDTVQPRQGHGSSLGGSALNRRRRERRGDGLRSLLFARAKGRRRPCPLPRAGRQEGRRCSGSQGEAGDPHILQSWDHPGPHWRDVFSCLRAQLSMEKSRHRLWCSETLWAGTFWGRFLAAAKKFGSLGAS